MLVIEHDDVEPIWINFHFALVPGFDDHLGGIGALKVNESDSFRLESLPVFDD